MISWENPWGASRDLLYRIRTLPNFLVWSLLGFVSGWVQTRRVATLVIGLPSLVIASLFFEVFLDAPLRGVIATFFTGATLALVVGLTYFLREVHAATAMLRDSTAHWRK